MFIKFMIKTKKLVKNSFFSKKGYVTEGGGSAICDKVSHRGKEVKKD